MGALTFPKGVHLEEHKELTASKPIEVAPLPDTVYVPLNDVMGGRGSPPKLVVKLRQEVKTGQLIAKMAERGFSANVHSPVTGKIQKFASVILGCGVKVDGVVIKRTGEDEWDESILREPQEPPDDPRELLKLISDAGIIGMGGAAFPTHVKLQPPTKVDTLIINGAECEPYLTADHRLMVEKPEGVVKGTLIMAKILNAENIYIGVEDNKPDAIEALRTAAENTPVKVVKLRTKYPQGSEKHLIYAITRRMVPSGKLPAHVGVVVQNAATAYAVYEAVYFRKPLIERVVTVTGSGVQKPSNLLVRIGTPIRELIELCGGIKGNVSEIVVGGPMMGRSLITLDSPVSKAVNGIIVNVDEDWREQEILPCINCGSCAEHCPMGLVPTLLAKRVEAGMIDDSISAVLDCIECGTCVYVCPANQPLLQFIRIGKAELIKRRRKAKSSKT